MVCRKSKWHVKLCVLRSHYNGNRTGKNLYCSIFPYSWTIFYSMSKDDVLANYLESKVFSFKVGTNSRHRYLSISNVSSHTVGSSWSLQEIMYRTLINYMFHSLNTTSFTISRLVGRESPFKMLVITTSHSCAKLIT